MPGSTALIEYSSLNFEQEVKVQTIVGGVTKLESNSAANKRT
jgi:hypothetical protein